MTVETVLDAATVIVPLLVVIAIPLYERLALKLGRDGSRAYVEHDGRFLQRSYVTLVKSDPSTGWPTRVLRQVGRDLRSPVSFAVIAVIASSIALGAMRHDAGRTSLGIVLACGYMFLFVQTVREGPLESQLFEGNVESVKPPVFLSYGAARVRLDDGRTIEAGVCWRPVEARRRQGPVRVVFVGTPEKPRFVGFIGHGAVAVTSHADDGA